MIKTKPFFVITGMHRSFTSLAGNILNTVGVEFGNNLIGAHKSNPYGHFEDISFKKLNNKILKTNRCKWSLWKQNNIEINTKIREECHKLILQKEKQTRCIWGFKDPRATIILDLYKNYLNSKFIFMFRECEEVLYSLYKRAGKKIYSHPHLILKYYFTYCIYNKNIINFRNNYRTKTFIIYCYDLVNNPLKVVKKIENKFEIKLNKKNYKENIIDKKLLNKKEIMHLNYISKRFSNLRKAKNIFCELKNLKDS